MPAEDLSIIHYTKVIIPAYGDDEDWDEPAGLPTEIIPMLRPFGNYAGNRLTAVTPLLENVAGGVNWQRIRPWVITLLR